MRIAALASGSSGNALAVWTESCGVLIDAGISARRLTAGLDLVGFPQDGLEAVLVTHEHTDHVSGLAIIARRLRLPVYATAGTHAALDGRLSDVPRRVLVEPGTDFSVGPLAIRAFATSHDGAEPVGYAVTDGQRTVVIATDLGVVGHGVRRHLAQADCLVLEFNHDERMLMDGPYPWYLKKRIMSNVGHLSNIAAAAEVQRLRDAPVSVLILAHLSDENNEPRLAYQAASDGLERAGRTDVEVLVARRDRVLGPVAVGESDVTVEERPEGVGVSCTG